jgi:RND family efflux transporter MFP subunit
VQEPGTPLDPRPRASIVRWVLLFGLGTAALVSAGYLAGRSARPAETRDGRAGRVLYYVDPMHPSYRSDAPGKAPDCGMDLVAVYADEGSAQPTATSFANVSLTPDQEQAANLQTETVQPTSGARALRTVGRVVPDESLTYRVTAGVDGWLRRVFADRTGTRVKRGDRLSAFFTRDLSAPQQAYVYALQSYEVQKGSPAPAPNQLTLASQQLTATHDNLQFLGMGDAQIEELGRTRREIVDIDLTAPADGVILERHVSVGQRFARGDLLYRIANLERVWVLADVYASDATLLNAIRDARIEVEGMPPLEAKVPSAPPQFDEQGRTGKVRLEVENARGRLVPGMIVSVDLDVPARSVLTVHADAVIDSGTATRVFVAHGNGRYELRDVQIGRQEGDRMEIREGLNAGERVVTTGAFLLDSESRMKASSNRP